MLHRVLTAMAAALCLAVLALPAEANKAREFYAEPSASAADPSPRSPDGESALSRPNPAVAGFGTRDRKSGTPDLRGRGKNGAALAARYLGTNPTKMRRLWCANFMGLIERQAGRAGTGSNMARSYASYGRKISRSEVRPGDIAVMSRGRRGGHVGYFVGWAANGKAILISGNSRGGVVAKGQYATGRIFAWRRPG